MVIDGSFKVSKTNNKYDDVTMMTVSKHNLDNIKCGNCGKSVKTTCDVECGSKIQWIGFAILFVFGVIFSWIPFVIKKFHKHSHSCEDCKQVLFDSNQLPVSTQWKNAFKKEFATRLDQMQSSEVICKLDNSKAQSVSNDISGADQLDNGDDIENYKQEIRRSIVRVS